MAAIRKQLEKEAVILVCIISFGLFRLYCRGSFPLLRFSKE